MSESHLQQCSLSLLVENHPVPLEPGSIKIVFAILTHPTFGEVARLHAWHIDRRPLLGRCLWSYNTGKTDEGHLSCALSALFNEWGELRPWLIYNDYHKGLGLWRDEMNEGMLLFIGDIYVHHDSFKGHAESFILDLVLKSDFVGQRDFALMRTGYVGTDKHFNLDDWTHKTALFGKHYFRRVGRGFVFAYSGDPSHRSRCVAIEDDLPLEPRYVRVTKDGLLSTQVEGPGYATRRVRLYPLHSLLAEADSLPENKVEADIRSLYHQRPDVVHEQDDIGFTPIFVAVFKKNVRAVSVLIELGAGADINRRDNLKRTTALEFCASNMLSEREVEDGFHRHFVGNSEASLRIIWMMKKVLDWPGLEKSADSYVARRRWGCTCGNCTDGWYSRKMRQTLEYVAELPASSDHLAPSAFDSDGILPVGKADLDPTLQFIPFTLRVGLSLAFYKGYRSCLKAVMLFFTQKRSDTKEIPTCMSILSSILRDGILSKAETESVRFYLTKGGRLEYAIGCIVHLAFERSPLRQYACPAVVKFTLPFWDSVPSCKNDLEFKMVRYKMCPAFKDIWGPYTAPEDMVVQVDNPCRDARNLAQSKASDCHRCERP